MSLSSGIVLGVDGGGTGCRAVLIDQAGETHRRDGGPANVNTDFTGAVGTIASLISDLFAEAGMPPSGHMHLGLAGVTGAAIGARVQEALQARFPAAQLCVTGDQFTMAAGALGKGDGALIGVGTGSFVLRQRAGVVTCIGGRGIVLGDQASGGWLGLRLMQEAMLAHDGLRDGSPLADAFLAEFGRDPSAIITAARTARPVDFAAYAPRVLAAAEEGDALAASLVREGAAYLTAALHALGWTKDEALCLGGGLGPRYRPWLPPDMQAACREPLGTGLDGALRLAREAQTSAR